MNKRLAVMLLLAFVFGFSAPGTELAKGQANPDHAPQQPVLSHSGEIMGKIAFCGSQGNSDTFLYLTGESFVVKTDASGMFVFRYVPEGDYTLVTEVPGQAPVSQNVHVYKDMITQIGTIVICPDNDGDGFTADVDCDDNNPTINPGADEVCDDGLDNNCNNQVDEGCTTCTDADNDGFFAQAGCGTPIDCDDNEKTLFPGATETCNGRDDDCDGSVDEGFDVDDDGFTSCNGDCDDADPAINPNAEEICDGVDNDCNNFVDEGFDLDGDGFTTCGGDCNDDASSINPAAEEVCDGVDNNCDGQVDEGNVCSCGTDPTPPGGECPTICSGGCFDGNICMIDCSSAAGCSSSDIDCPPGFSCKVECLNEDACSNSTINCPDDYRCEVFCGDNGCFGTVINCSAEGSCYLYCGAGDSCYEAELNCGNDACTVDCDNTVYYPSVSCGNSCNCDFESCF